MCFEYRANEKAVSANGQKERSQADVVDPADSSARYFLQSMHLEFCAAATEVSLADPA